MVILMRRPARIDEQGSTTEARQAERERLQPSRFDLITSFFMALILLVGTLVLMLCFVWLTSRWSIRPRAIESIAQRTSGTPNPEGFERDFEPPGIEEVEELIEPTLPETMQTLTNAVSTVAASLVTLETSSAEASHGKQAGDSRPAGPETGEDARNITPRHLRWQLEFTARDLPSYAKQLDYFRIELGAVGGNVQGVDVVSNLVGPIKHRRLVDTATEKRLYFLWNSPSPLMKFDQRLLQQGGVELANRTIVKFIPAELENETLTKLELEYAQSKGYESVTSIAKTVFECKPQSKGYHFVVTSQRYRKGIAPQE